MVDRFFMRQAGDFAYVIDKLGLDKPKRFHVIPSSRDDGLSAARVYCIRMNRNHEYVCRLARKEAA